MDHFVPRELQSRGIRQRSLLGPFLFTVYENDLAMISSDTDICNYADDTAYCAHYTSARKVVGKLEKKPVTVPYALIPIT